MRRVKTTIAAKKTFREKETIQAKFVEVTEERCHGNVSKMIKSFMKKVRNEEVLAPFYDRLAYHKTKGQKERTKKLKGAWIQKKRQKAELELEKELD